MKELDLLLKLEEEERKRNLQRSADYQQRIEHYKQNPFDYFVERLGFRPETLDWELLPEYQQHRWDGTRNPYKKILEAIVKNKWVGVESAIGTGKTRFGAGLVLWFLECFENSIVITTAPKRDQLALHIWREITNLFPLFGRGYLNNLKLRMVDEEDRWLAVGFVAGVKASEDSATKAQGFHNEHMLIICEETPGIPSPVLTAFENTSVAPHNIIVAFGNPDNQLDNLHLFCNQPRVEHIRISVYDHPNIVTRNPLFIPGATTQQKIIDMLDKYGEDHPLFLSRARGICPVASSDALIKIEWVKASIDKYKELSNFNGIIDEEKVSGDKAIGCDVANSEAGDKAAIAIGKGNVCLNIVDFPCDDSNQLGHKLYRIMLDENIKPTHIGVDGVGVGAGTVNTLKEYGISSRNVNIQGAAAPEDTGEQEDFNNLRSQMWWRLREDLRLGNIIIPDDKDLISDIITPKWWVRNGKIIVESKDEIKKRLGRSPNKGDALVYWNWIRNKGGHELQIFTRKTRLSKTITEGY